MATVRRPPLPLSQQVSAWVLQALGLETPGVSRSTRRSALSGKPIERRWDDLLASFLVALGGVTAGHESIVQDLARRWDQAVGELPSVDLTMAERLHAPLQLAAPQLGARLGVLACICAAKTGTPVSDWLWVTRPFDGTFFGQVFLTLARTKFKGATNLELADRFDTKLDWRTVERWEAGSTALPNPSNIRAIEHVLGSASSPALRAARLAAALRNALAEWVGPEMRDDFAAATATIAHRTAELLCQPPALTWMLEDLVDALRGPGDDRVVQLVRPWLPAARPDATAEEAAGIVADATADPATALPWLLPMLLAAPTPRLLALVGTSLGAPGLPLVASLSPAQLVKQLWLARVVFKVVAGVTPTPVRRCDGTELDLAPTVRELAKRCLAHPLGFHRSDAADDEATVLHEVAAATGANLDAAVLDEALAGEVLKGEEEWLDDATVAANPALSLARATRLAEHRDVPGALVWLKVASQGDARARLGTRLQAADTIAALGHAILDTCRRARAVLRTSVPEDPGRLQLAAELGSTADAVLRLVTTFFTLDDDDDLVWTEPEAFVPIAALLVRLALLAQETEPNDPALVSLFEQVRTNADRLLERHATHGRLWAVRTLAEGDEGAYRRLSKKAVHYGGGALLETVSNQVDADLGLTQDAG